MAKTTEFITLGTAGGPVPNRYRAQPAHAVVHAGRTVLIDCGEGAMGQLMRAGIDLRQVHDIVISHHHFDHIGSLYACLGKNMMLQRRIPLNIYGPEGTRQIIDALCTACDVPWDTGFGIPGQKIPHPRDFVHVREIQPGDTIDIQGIRVSCCENTHIRAEDQFGQDGPISLSLRFDTESKSVVFTGDTGPCRGLEHFSAGAELLVGEMMDVERIMQRVRKKNPDMSAHRIEMIGRHMAEHHLNPTQLGELATRAGVDHVVAVHLALDEMTPENAPFYVDQIGKSFAGKITIANDLDRF